ncbi:hypothetical protein IVA86_20275 [Bradyrhizobium sp. 146]|uniref:hypothetical protein n=1 Tax=Bradyrhizobium sp. 146 TaxID=2782622 RepID=UPI001FFA337C|nr:hypothetical protein [Bradyrhizobium sp. 146]MCK1703675.1 hypothetical protein [Bradyrhizobium sp. 146]
MGRSDGKVPINQLAKPHSLDLRKRGVTAIERGIFRNQAPLPAVVREKGAASAFWSAVCLLRYSKSGGLGYLSAQL